MAWDTFITPKYKKLLKLLVCRCGNQTFRINVVINDPKYNQLGFYCDSCGLATVFVRDDNEVDIDIQDPCEGTHGDNKSN